MVMVERETSEQGGGEEPSGLDPVVMLSFVHESFDGLREADLTVLDDDWLAHLVRACDSVATRALAASAAVAAEAERRGHREESGFFTSKAYLRHHGLLSGSEALMRTKIVRLFDLLPAWKASAEQGDVGVDQVRLMAQIASNPRLHEALTAGGGAELLFDAEWVQYDVFEARARDWARLGQLYLNGGLWKGRRIVSADWIYYVTRHTPTSGEENYGAGFWINDAPEGPRWSTLPPDTDAADGFQQQRIFIVPSRQLVVVRLGATWGDRSHLERLAADVIAALR